MATYTISGNNKTTFAGTTAISGEAKVGTTYNGYEGAATGTRYKFTTDGYGATAISFKTTNGTADIKGSSSSDESIGRMRFAIGTGETTYRNYKGDKGYAATGSYGKYVKGSLSVKLLPNTTYYLWIFPASNFSGTTRYEIGNCVLTTSGSYGTVSTISASNGTFGSNVPITLSNSVGGVTNTVTVSCGGITKTLGTKSGTTSFTWSPSLNEYGPKVTNAKTATATITTTTYYGDTSWGSSSKTITMSFPSSGNASAVPSIDDVPITYDNSTSAALSEITVFVQGYSKAKAEILASGKYGATISGYALTINGATVSGTANIQTSAPVTTSGEVTATITVTDSRGFTASVTRTFTVQPYKKPTLNTVKLFRADAQGEEADDGTYLSASAVCDIASLDGQNHYSMTVAYKTTTGQYGDETSFLSGETVIVPDPSSAIALSADVTYIARITVTDRLGNAATATKTIPSQKWAMKFSADGNAVGFGKAPEGDKRLEIPSDWEVARKSQDGSRTAYALFEDSAAYEQIRTLVNQIYSVISGIALVVTETGGFSVSTHTAADNTDVTITYQKHHSTTPYLIVAGNNASASVFATPGIVSRSATGAVLRMRNIAAHTYAASFRWYALEAPASITPSETETYNGDYTVVPMAFDEQILQTRSKLMSDDVTVTQVPLYETSNEANGTTAYIAATQEELSDG